MMTKLDIKINDRTISYFSKEKREKREKRRKKFIGV
jgi:hypothetical protein